MNYLTILKFVGPAIVVLFLVWFAQNKLDAARAEGRAAGYDAATKVCADETVPAARAEEQQKCSESTNILKESCDALQFRLDDNTARYVGLLRKYDSCRKIHIAAGNSKNDRAAQRDVLPVQGSVLVGDLASIAKSCDDQTAQLLEWQSWHKKVEAHFKKWGEEAQNR